jgi:DNA-binding MarR family transcriptional regulator
MEQLFSELFEAAAVGRRIGEYTAATQGQSQSRWQVLWTIDLGGLTVPQVARRLGLTRQNIQRVVGELEAEGFVELQVNPDHKTSPLVFLTDSGVEVLGRINDTAQVLHESLLTRFSAEDVEELRRLLAGFLVAMKEQEIVEGTAGKPTRRRRRPMAVEA